MLTTGRIYKYYLFSGLLTLLCIFLFRQAASQFYNGSQLTFGKSRVQYDDFFWTFYKFEKFDTYFYLNGKELAQFTAQYAEKSIPEIEQFFKFTIEDKIQFLVFNSLSDLKQSNIGMAVEEGYNTGGITQIIGGKVMLYFTGSYSELEQQIRAGIIQVILNQMMFGSNIGAQVKNNIFFTMPGWYMDGLIAYLSKGWNTTADNLVRDAIQTGRFDKFNSLTGAEAALAGHSLWQFIEMKYGRTGIPDIVYLARVNRNTEKGFQYVLGIPFKTLIQEWLAYYKSRYTNITGIPSGKPLLKKTKKNLVYSQLRISPDGRYVAFATNEIGQYKVWIKDLETGKKRRILKGGYLIDDRTDYSFPILAWHPGSEILAIIAERSGEVELRFQPLTGEKPVRLILYPVEKVLDFSYSHDGSRLVMSAVQRGQSDIFIYHLASSTYENITNDLFDDLNPRFLNWSKDIVFSSNRVNDTLQPVNKTDIFHLPHTKDLFLYSYTPKEKVLRRLTNTPPTDEIEPMPYAEGYIAYLGDANGIFNRYLARTDSVVAFVDTIVHYRYATTSYPVTSSGRSILSHDIQPQAKKVGQVIFANQMYHLQLDDLVSQERATAIDLQNTPFVEEIRKAESLQQVPDSVDTKTKEPGKTGKQRFRAVMLSEVANTDNFPVFPASADTTGQPGKEIQPSPTRQATVFLGYPAQDSLRKRDTVIPFPPKQRNYDVEYFFNQLVTQIDFTYLNSTYQPYAGGGNPIFFNPGMNALFKVGITDLMENYHLVGGVRLNFSLVNNEYLLSYSNLRRRLDHQIVFHRQTLEELTNYSYIRHRWHELYYVLSWPFTPVLQVKGTGSIRYDRAIYLSTDAYNLSQPDRDKYWGSLKGEIIYDNTRNLGVNLFVGTRYKVFGEYYQLVNKSGVNAVILGFDYRNYQRVHRTLIWANRLAASTSFGNHRLIYFMGGVDNWLFPSFDPNTPVNQEMNFAFQTLATNLRGFNQNIRNGNNFILLNSELRLPVFRYFMNRPIRSDFLNTLQIVAFGDIGTAWSGSNPFASDNVLYSRFYRRGPMFIRVETRKDPLVGGFGGGLRSRLFGYFIRGDLAWGVEDGRIRKPIFYLSLSLDF
ncbi:MAG: hypothetical protein FJY10_06435 [Bacteroidetes bacterium]|nr:hypothetical protein [Bacteroidota bacterium]